MLKSQRFNTAFEFFKGIGVIRLTLVKIPPADIFEVVSLLVLDRALKRVGNMNTRGEQCL